MAFYGKHPERSWTVTLSGPVRTCPGCGLQMPLSERSYDGKFNASPECWALYEEVIAREYESPALFGQVHQLTVDTYAVQHAGGRHPDKSVCVHLAGLYLALERGLPSRHVPPLQQRLARRKRWPHLAPPTRRTWPTVLDVVRADSPEAHRARVREWAREVWQAWSTHHDTARELVAEIMGPEESVAPRTTSPTNAGPRRR